MATLLPKRLRLDLGRAKKSGAKNPCSSVARTLRTLKRYDVRPEQIDDVILQAINVSLCLESDGDEFVAEGFNNDIVINGRAFGRR
jgi:hypothetical protein